MRSEVVLPRASARWLNLTHQASEIQKARRLAFPSSVIFFGLGVIAYVYYTHLTGFVKTRAGFYQPPLGTIAGIGYRLRMRAASRASASLFIFQVK